MMGGKVMGANEKEILKHIYHNDIRGPKAFNRIWEERGWDELHIEGDKSEKATYSVDKNEKKTRHRKRNGWVFN